MPKYDVKGRGGRYPRGGSYQHPRASFVIPHYGYFNNNPAGFPQNLQPDAFGETLQPNGAVEPTQMHQIITLQNGQMMIRRVDMAFP